MKLVTPVSLLFATAVLAIYSVYAFRIAMIEESLPLAIAGGASAVACVATALMKPWSKYLVYLLTSGFVGKWGFSVYDGIRSGYFGFQFGSMGAEIHSLAPGMMMVALSCICAWLVYRNFRVVGVTGDHGQGGLG